MLVREMESDRDLFINVGGGDCVMGMSWQSYGNPTGTHASVASLLLLTMLSQCTAFVVSTVFPVEAAVCASSTSVPVSVVVIIVIFILIILITLVRDHPHVCSSVVSQSSPHWY